MSNPNKDPNKNDIIELTEIIEEDIMQLPKNNQSKTSKTNIEDDLFADLELLDEPTPPKKATANQPIDLDDLLNDFPVEQKAEQKHASPKNVAPDLLEEINIKATQNKQNMLSDDDLLNSLLEDDKKQPKKVKSAALELDDLLDIPEVKKQDTENDILNLEEINDLDLDNLSTDLSENIIENPTQLENLTEEIILLEENIEATQAELNAEVDEILTLDKVEELPATPHQETEKSFDDSELFSNLLDTDKNEEVESIHATSEELITPNIAESIEQNDSPEDNEDTEAQDTNTDELDALLEDVIASAPSILPTSINKENMLTKLEIENFQHLSEKLEARISKLEETLKSQELDKKFSEFSEKLSAENSNTFNELLEKIENKINIELKNEISQDLENKITNLIEEKILALKEEQNLNVIQITNSVKDALAEDLERSAAAAAAKVIKEEVIAMLTEE
ncbi:hypothetical protein [Desulfovibrio litoralis]|uniref:Uncharacterized protein n=1 Tax=Desulfovibrio litoralis DSM 11393 TaxID=1121455 RepID=A0A1M7SZ08_9BACT|nr:hypothetical protein [Desulfovibrio litoralis]SHN63745.1 hypothetical protein SAMN02745728_01401 [Desulfovibrio litoralis DSM 11393]